MLDVKPFQETLFAHMCGPASLKMVLDFYGIDLPEHEIARRTGIIPNVGTEAKDLIRVAQELGFDATVHDNCDYSDAERWLLRGTPLIVDWFTAGRRDYSNNDVPDGHYSVLMGMDDTHVYLQDPEIGGCRRIAKDDFLRVWFDFHGNEINRSGLIVRQVIAIAPHSRSGETTRYSSP